MPPKICGVNFGGYGGGKIRDNHSMRGFHQKTLIEIDCSLTYS